MQIADIITYKGEQLIVCATDDTYIYAERMTDGKVKLIKWENFNANRR